MKHQNGSDFNDLVRIIRFVEELSVQIHGLSDEAEIFRAIGKHFASSKQYEASILLLTEDGSRLRIAESLLTSRKIGSGEKAAGVRLKDYQIDLNKSSIYRRVIREGQTVRVNVSDIIGELFPRPVAYLISKVTGYHKAPCILTPLERQGEIVGALAISSTRLAEALVPSVKNLARHISISLELACEHAGRTRSEEVLLERTHDIKERVKELNLLYNVSELAEKWDTSLETMLEGIVDLIPPAWQYPEITCAGITVEHQMFKTKDYKETIWKQSAQITVQDNRVGTLEVYYVEERPRSYEGPFLKEERALINAVAERLGRIIERRKLQEELRSSEERLMILYESAPDGIYLSDLKGTFIDGNQATEKLTGYKREELIGKSFLKLRLLSAKQIPKAAVNLAKNALGKPTGPDQFILNQKGGKQIALEINTYPVKIKGKPLVLAIARDITERKRREEEIERGAEEWKRTFNSIADFVSIQDKDFRFIRVNKSLADALKVKPKDLIGKRCYEILHKSDKPWPNCPLKEVFEDGKTHTTEVEDPNIGLPLLITASPIFDEKGELVGGVHIAKDITRRKKTEQEIQAYAQELMVMNEQLKVETKKAKESDRLKSEFLANMSHEIRTPLTAISGATHLLNESSLSSEQRKLCDIVAQSGKHLLELINDILDLAIIEAGEVSLEEEEFSLKKTLNKLIPGFKLEAEEKGTKLDLIYPDSLPVRIISDERKLIQILSNLITNALKFTEKGKIEVRVEELANSKIQISVKDTGIGISKEKLPHIFDKFYQVNGTIRRKYQGTGLGLTIVKELVNLLGGEIEVQSTLKKGSTFSFSFSYKPVEEKIEEIVPDKAQDKALFKMEQKARGDINILIAEDDDFNYYVIDRFLKDYTTTRAKDGKDVLEKIEKKRFDLVLMDIQMPKMDGLTATRKIREKNLDLPIIALTAKSMKGDEEKCLAAGCTDYISKPIVPDELIARIEQYTTERPVRGEESSPVKVLDVETLLKNSGKDKGLARKTLHMFVEYLPQQLSQIRKAITDDNSQDLEHLSHSLKGAAKSVGAPRIAKLASNLEKTAANSTIGQSESTFSRLEKEKKRFQRATEKMSIS